MRVLWKDIVGAARETSEALVGKEWVEASLKARTLLADLADEVERLRKERAALIDAVVQEGFDYDGEDQYVRETRYWVLGPPSQFDEQYGSRDQAVEAFLRSAGIEGDNSGTTDGH